MSARFVLNVTTLVAAAFVVVVSMAFAPAAAGWIAFGVSTGIAVVGFAGLVLAHTRVDRAAQAGIATIALWSLVPALVFSGVALTWIVFADAAAVAAMALGQLAANEMSTRRTLRSNRPSAVPGTNRVGVAA